MDLKTIYLYRFTNNDQTFWYTNVGSQQVLDETDEIFVPEAISHTRPKITDDITKADVTISLPFDNPVMILHTLAPVPFKTTVEIYKYYDGVTDPEIYWRGIVVGPGLNDPNGTLQCNTKLSSLNIEGLPETPQILCNARLGDGRCPVNLELSAQPVTVTIVDTDDNGVSTVTVTGITQPDAWYERGTIRAPNGDWRFIRFQVGGLLTLDHAFPADTLAADDVPDIFPGCDRAYPTCIAKFGDETGEGDAFLGEPTLPNTNPIEYGRF